MEATNFGSPITDAILGVEQEGEMRGWDSDASLPTLFTVHATENGGAPWAVMFAPPQLQNYIRDKIARFGDHGLMLMHMCDVFDSDEIEAGKRNDHVRAVGFRAESYGVTEDDWEEAQKYKDITEFPGVRESRNVWVADSENRWWHVHRIRGEEDVDLHEVSVEDVGPTLVALTRMLNLFMPVSEAVPVPSIVREEFR